jgi:hypothetical protein
VLQRKEFASLMEHIWGGPVAANFSASLRELYDDDSLAGHNVFVWLGRTVPAHYVLRALRNTWPGLVSHIAILRNTAENPSLSPELMEVFDETFEPSVRPELNSAAYLAIEASKQPPTARGGFVVRITNLAGEVTFVPLRGLRENTLEAADAWRLTNPEAKGLDARGLLQGDTEPTEDEPVPWAREVRWLGMLVAACDLRVDAMLEQLLPDVAPFTHEKKEPNSQPQRAPSVCSRLPALLSEETCPRALI